MELLKGEVGPILYNKDDYTVFILYTSLFHKGLKRNEIKIDGVCNVCTGDHIEVGGEYTNSEKYGRGFRLSFVRHELPSDVRQYASYLTRQVNGVGPVTARNIVDVFGRETFDVIKNRPEKLLRIPRMSLKKAYDISSQVSMLSSSEKEQMLFAKLELTPYMSGKIKEKYKGDTEKILMGNPYRMIGEVERIGFKKADEIALKAGIKKDSAYRIQAGIEYAIKSKCDREGHSYLVEEDIYKDAEKCLSLDRGSISSVMKDMTEEGLLIKDGERIYIPQYYQLETMIAEKIAGLYCYLGGKNVEDKILQIESDKNIKLDEVQRSAVIKAVENGLSIITGGPGTGKTTVLDTLIAYLEKYEGSEISIAAPTGKAAKRINEQTGKDAITIHRLVASVAHVEETKDGIVVTSSDNKEGFITSDTVIVDEMSMVSLPVMKMLLDVIVKGTRVVLVGDVDQLPSIGIGQVLRDLIECGYIPVTKLENIYRQAADSHIIVNAHAINKGKLVELNNRFQDFFFVQRDERERERVINDIKMLVGTFIPKTFGVNPLDVQVLCPMRKKQFGVYEMNAILQEFLNPPSSDKCEKAFMDTVFREGDKVIHIKNDYEIEWVDRKDRTCPESGSGVFNGEVGIIQSINLAEKQMTVLYDDTRTALYDFAKLNELELAYAMTIHKSQGSEYDAVILPLLTGGDIMMYNKSLLYTAITRAKKCVGILGQRDVVQRMIGNNIAAKRNTTLQERIKASFCR